MAAVRASRSRRAAARAIAASALLVALGVGPAPSARAQARTPEELLATLAMLEDTRCPDAAQVAAYLQDAFAPAVRARAALALARLQDSTAVDGLADRLRRDAAADVRREAAFALGETGHRGAYDALAWAQENDGDLEVRALAVEALGKIGDRRATGVCVRNLAEREPRLRREAAIALWRLQDTTAVLALTTALHESDPEARAMVVWALERMAPARLVVPEVAKLAADASWLVRAYVARTLGRQGSSDGLAALFRLLEDAEVRVRVNACRALGQIADSSAVPQMLARLDDPHPHVRETAVTALGRLRERDVAPRLAEMAKDREPAVRGAVAGAASELLGAADSAAAWALLRPLTADRHERVRAQAWQGLARVRHPEARAALIRCLAGGTTGAGSAAPTLLERAAAAGALAELGDTTARPALLAALRETDAGLVASAVEALGDLGGGDPATVPAVIVAIRANASPNEPDVLVSGLEVLGKLKAAEGVPLAGEALASPQPRVREAARSLLRAVLGDSAAAEVARAHGPPPWQPAPLTDYEKPLPSAKTAVIRTVRGEITIELYPEDAPRTVANFVTLARLGYYDKLAFHRVVPNFVVQDGDPTGTGWGGPGYAIRCEYNRRRYGTGTVGMALSGKDTGGSQYFITHSPQPHLDGRYTVFGQVVKGFEVLEKLTLGDAIKGVTVE